MVRVFIQLTPFEQSLACQNTLLRQGILIFSLYLFSVRINSVDKSWIKPNYPWLELLPLGAEKPKLQGTGGDWTESLPLN